MTEKKEAPRKRRKRRRGEIININTEQLLIEEDVVTIVGDFDILTISQIEPGLTATFDQGEDFVVNLLKVSYIDAGALALLERLQERASFVAEGRIADALVATGLAVREPLSHQ